MKDPARLRRNAEMLEAEAAMLAAALAGQLQRSASRRRGLRAMLKSLVGLRAQLKPLLAQYERQIRAQGRGEDRPGISRAEIETRRYFRDLRHRLRLWRSLLPALQTVLARPTLPLYRDLPPRHDPGAQQWAVSDAVFMALHRVVNPAAQDAGAKAFGCYADIPMRPSIFVAHAQAAYRVALAQRRPGPLRFLDVGCGGGVKCLLAAELFPQADGLDYDAGYVAAATRAMAELGAERCTILQADALEYAGYPDYDVIYFYQPMQTDHGLVALEDRILAEARPGTILIAPYQKFHLRAAGLPCALIDGAVYVAGITEAEADALRAAAERIGPDILHPAHAADPNAGWLAPLWRACAANGWVP